MMTCAEPSFAVLMTYYYEWSKWLAYAAIIAYIVVYILGVVDFFISPKKKLAAFNLTITFILLVVASFFAWRSGENKRAAETLNRQYEYVMGFHDRGSTELFHDHLSQELITAYLAEAGSFLEGYGHTALNRKIYCKLAIGYNPGSPLQAGRYRMLEIVGEAAWWSAQIARAARNWCAGAFVVCFVIALSLTIFFISRDVPITIWRAASITVDY